ncbi:MAG: hypothetical protein IT384_34750 [Deltaproteobacteria bacterium]|nr:hypothetical protein [Deltaproteobacteria bacterium]
MARGNEREPPRSAGDARAPAPGGEPKEGDQEPASEPRRTEDRLTNPKSRRFQATPSAGEFVSGQKAPKAGAKFAEVLPASRTPAVELPEPDMRPPPFLSMFEAMRDIYFRSRGRASPKTRELLESPELEDLVKMLVALHEDEKLLRHPDAKHRRPLLDVITREPGPLLAGLHDARLREPWRLFLDGWDIWLPEEGGGIELFWEGEGEDEGADDAIEILQVLRLREGEVTLEGRVGESHDRITFDGAVFFRLKTEA